MCINTTHHWDCQHSTQGVTKVCTEQHEASLPKPKKKPGFFQKLFGVSSSKQVKPIRGHQPMREQFYHPGQCPDCMARENQRARDSRDISPNERANLQSMGGFHGTFPTRPAPSVLPPIRGPYVEPGIQWESWGQTQRQAEAHQRDSEAAQRRHNEKRRAASQQRHSTQNTRTSRTPSRVAPSNDVSRPPLSSANLGRRARILPPAERPLPLAPTRAPRRPLPPLPRAQPRAQAQLPTSSVVQRAPTNSRSNNTSSRQRAPHRPHINTNVTDHSSSQYGTIRIYHDPSSHAASSAVSPLTPTGPGRQNSTSSAVSALSIREDSLLNQPYQTHHRPPPQRQQEAYLYAQTYSPAAQQTQEEIYRYRHR